MTFVTRAANRRLAASPAGPRRLWLRRNSTVWAHLDPTPTFPCGCGERLEMAADKHNIGFVFIRGVKHDKFCNGEEVAT